MSIQLRWFFLLSILLAIIIVPFLLFENEINEQISKFLSLGYPSDLLAVSISGILALDVLLPIPSSLVSISAGVLLGFFEGTLVCWIGMCLGCLLGYWIDMTGGTPAVRHLVGEKELERATELAQNMGTSALILARAVPVIAEASAVAAGAARVSFPKFMFVTSLANLGISTAYAGIGAYVYTGNSFLFAFAGAIAVPGAGLIIIHLLRKLRVSSSTSPQTVDRAFDAASSQLVVFSAEYSYPVHFTQNALDPCNQIFVRAVTRLEPDKRHKIVIIADCNFTDAWPEFSDKLRSYVNCHSRQLEIVGNPLSVPGGEQCKDDPALLDDIYRMFHQRGIDRHSTVICFGGGAVLDLVGYAAATAHRGIRIVRFPTTVLAQNDAGIGVKNAINKFSLKNFIGTFQPPVAVINDSAFLQTLSQRDRRAGLAEAVKVALIRDKSFFEFLEEQEFQLRAFEEWPTQRMIERCAELHLRQISKGGDPFESGSIRPLDFGHWAAHKLESLSDFDLRHGEAVAIGIALDSRYSVLTDHLRIGQDVRICRHLRNLGFELWHPALEEEDHDGRLSVFSGLKEFQEHLGGELTITLLSDIRRGVEVHEIDHELMQTAVTWLHAPRGDDEA